MSDVATKSDLRTLKEDLVDRLDAILEQAKETNGRVREGEKVDAAHEVRLKNLEREIFSRRHHRKGDPCEHEHARAPDADPMSKSLTRWDAAIVIGTLSAAGYLLNYFGLL